jgi:sugar transferase (PEP-CTERM/EpsH1 system associated)
MAHVLRCQAVKILFLSQRVPYPPNRGDKITTWRLIDRLRRDHDVTAIAFAHDDADEEAARQLTEMGIPTHTVRHDERKKKLTTLPLFLTSRPLTLGVYGSKELQRLVDEHIKGCDLAYAYSSSMGAFLLPHRELPRIMHFGELDSDKWRQYSERTGFPMSWVYRREWKTLLSFEREVAGTFSNNVLCTPLEEEIFHEQIPGTPTTVLRNGVDLGFYHPRENAPEPNNIAFTGVMNYYPNVDGCVWFADEILPRVREKVPDAHFTIIGSKPDAEIQRLGERPGVTVTGFVDDTRDWLRKAHISVAPLRIARGIQNKVLEALAMGLPTVGTTSATQGVDGTPERDYLVRDDATSFAGAVVELLTDAERARALAEQGRRFVEETYWEVVFRHLDEIVGAATGTPVS